MAVNPVSQPYNWTFRRVVWATLVLTSVVLGFWLLYRFSQVVFILFIAIVMGTVIRPAVAWLHRRGLPRIGGVILVYTLLLALLIGFGLLVFPLIIEQGVTLAVAVPESSPLQQTTVERLPSISSSRATVVKPPPGTVNAPRATIRFSQPLAKNASDRLSGDQKGRLAPSVASRGLASVEASVIALNKVDRIDIADLWVPYFCVSTNLTRGKCMVHDEGPLHMWVGTSMCACIGAPGKATLVSLRHPVSARTHRSPPSGGPAPGGAGTSESVAAPTPVSAGFSGSRKRASEVERPR